MPDKEQNNQSDFLIEKIKTRPINRRKLIRRTLITAAMAVIFGLVACVTFLVLEPVISNRLTPEEEPPYVVFPEDQEEMSPEEMLAENLPTESPASTISPSEENSPVEEQIREILEETGFSVKSYAQVYDALQDFVYERRDDENDDPALAEHMVTIRGVTSDTDWFDNVQESSNQAVGVIVAENDTEFFILVNYAALKDAESLALSLSDDYYQIPAELKGVDKDTDLAVLSVQKMDMPAEWLETGGLCAAPLGSSSKDHLAGTPVVALGSPVGLGYGMITSDGTRLNDPDRSYKLLSTNIYGSKNAEGVLFNLQGQVIGIITGDQAADMENMISAYGITEIKRIIEKLTNESTFAYLGITGTDVTLHAFMDFEVPYGAYVTEVEMDSPAMLAGIQVGDVITGIDNTEIASFSAYCTQLMQLAPGQRITLTVMRQSQGEYKEMHFTMELGER